MGRDTAASGGDEDTFPNIGAKERGADVGVLEGEEGGIERIGGRESGLWVGRLAGERYVSRGGSDLEGRVWAHSLICDDCFPVAAFHGEGLFAWVGIWRLEGEGCPIGRGEENFFSREGNKVLGAAVEHYPAVVMVQ